eukprot:gene566-966_t
MDPNYRYRMPDSMRLCVIRNLLAISRSKVTRRCNTQWHDTRDSIVQHDSYKLQTQDCNDTTLFIRADVLTLSFEFVSFGTNNYADYAFANGDIGPLSFDCNGREEQADFGEGPLTVLAPTNAAFEAFFEERQISKIQLLEFEGLPEILTYHMLEGSLAYDEFRDGTELCTVQGKPLDVSIVGYSDVKMNGAAVTKAEVAGDALFHQVDTVLVPPYVMWTKVMDPKEILSLEGWAPEVINGRIAMVGFLLAFFGELNTGDAFTTQLFSHFGEFLKCATLWTAASFAPSFQNRMGYCADPKTLATNSSWQAAIKGGPIPDYVEPYFTPDVELLNGRVAMVAIALMIVIETIKGSALF